MKILKYFIVIIIAVYCCVNNVFAQNKTIDCERIPKLIYLLDKYHYQPMQLNKANTDKILENFYNDIDPYGFFITKNDINSFSNKPVDLNSASPDDLCKFINEVAVLYKTRVKENDSLTSVILSKPFNFSSKDSLVFSKNNKPNRVNNKDELKEQLRKWLKYRVIYGIYMSVDSSNNTGKNSYAFKNINKKEEEFRKKLLEKEKKKNNLSLSYDYNFAGFVLDEFLNSIASSYDPHSSYFTPVEKKSFEKEISTDEYSFGIEFGENDNDEVIIEKLVPGGPAWKSKELFSGDKIIKIKWPDKKAIDLSFADIDDVESAMYSSDSKTVDITVRNSEGQIKTVTLKKEKMSVDENKVKSYILKGDKKIGYISLPGFYTDMMDNYSSQGCSNDVAKEILKLKKDGIDGLILDIRNNGGGSLNEAIELAGIFIDEGTLILTKAKSEPPHLLKDKNRGTAYDGPLMIMVNEHSASASEVMAAVMQDYHRGVIVGSPTFGKATAQQIIPLDTAYNSKIANNNISLKDGYLKLTVGKIFRVYGKSYQREGIIPDVYLPEVYYGLKFRETSYDNALTTDSINKKVIFNPLPFLPVKAIADKSKERIAKDEKFVEIKHLNDSLKKAYKKNYVYYTDTTSFLKYEKINNHLLKKIEALDSIKTANYNVVNNSTDNELYKMDLYKKDINDELLNRVGDDIYIDESYKIMIDLINFGASK